MGLLLSWPMYFYCWYGSVFMHIFQSSDSNSIYRYLLTRIGTRSHKKASNWEEYCVKRPLKIGFHLLRNRIWVSAWAYSIWFIYFNLISITGSFIDDILSWIFLLVKLVFLLSFLLCRHHDFSSMVNQWSYMIVCYIEV